jgi:acetolactate synthase-1/2/3 large subunit
MKSKKGFSRRGFLKGAAAGAAAGAAGLVVPAPEATAQQTAEVARAAAQPPSPRLLARETGPVPSVDVQTADYPGSDYMVDVLKSLNLEYIAANPGSSFRSLHESFVNYGGNKNPEWLTCCHEESSVGIAHGYYRIEGKPMAIGAHGTVGLQHASMMIYDAFVARVPIYMFAGNTLGADERRPGVEWNHSAQDAAAFLRDFLKWDDTPKTLTHFGESAVRAYKIGMSVPMGPTLIVADSDLQEEEVENRSKLRIPKLTLASPPSADPSAVKEIAKMLVNAQSPLIIVGHNAVRNEEGMKLLVELAETLQANVQNAAGRGMPNQHPLSGGGVANADVIMGLEVDDLWGATNDVIDQQTRASNSRIKPGTKLISISTKDLYTKSNYQDFQRYPEVDISVAADSQASLAPLIEACKSLMSGDRKRVAEERGKKLAAAHAQAKERARTDATYAWNASPISTQRMRVELWNVIKNKDWSLVGGQPSPLWNVDKYYRSIGGGGAAAVGSALPTAVGAALANKKYGRFSVTIQNDGDLMYAPGALWTAVHHRIPLLFVMHNNRAYHQEVMHLQRMANRRQRGITTAHIGTRIEDPYIDYATLARSVGVYGEGPITNPNDLGPALQRAVARVEKGETALVDVVTQPR